MANLQGQNALMIEQGLPQGQRLQILRELVVKQLGVLASNKSVGEVKRLSSIQEKTGLAASKVSQDQKERK